MNDFCPTIRNGPPWALDASVPEYPALIQDVKADVCVIGAGIAGLSVAYQAARAGLSVVVLDDGEIAGAGSATSVTTAHLSNAIDARYVEIERLHGERGAQLAASSHTQAIAEIESIAAREGIECGFMRLDGFLFSEEAGGEELVQRELLACHRAGLPEVEFVKDRAAPPLEGLPRLRFTRQAQMHPLKYLAGLARAIGREGGVILTRTHAEKIERGTPARIKAGRNTITANFVVVATNAPINDLVAVHTKQAAYMTYVIGVSVPKGSLPRALYWDTNDPYHYVRLQPAPDDDAASDLLIVGGEDHKTGQAEDTEERFERLLAWTKARFIQAGAIEFAWTGQIMQTIDGLAFIGRNPLDESNVFIATGDCGMGMTHGTIAGMLIRDLILGRENPWTELYDPRRKTLRAAATYVKEAANVAAQYLDWLTDGDVSSLNQIQPGCGAVVRRGLSKVAIFRDEEGVLHERSAACPHLGCVVDWNNVEKTWDCPCHGSRFDRFGSVINGPANRDLKEVEYRPPVQLTR